ncbi:MAG: oxidoreductase, partial [Clostridia bacterium]|nr:oxidoreductase [Clostridia bacterium]
DFINKDYLGEVYYAKASYIRRAGSPGGWFGDKAFSGGGPLIDLGVHVIDLSRYLLGNPKPITVFGNTFSKLGPRRNLKNGSMAWVATTKVAEPVFNVEDLATAFVKFDNGAFFWVETSCSLHTEKENGNIELHGTKAGLKLDPFTLFTETNDMLSTIKIDGPTGTGDFFGMEMEHFITSVEKGITCTTPAADGSVCRSPAADGVELMKILDAIYESASTGKSVDIK